MAIKVAQWSPLRICQILEFQGLLQSKRYKASPRPCWMLVSVLELKWKTKHWDKKGCDTFQNIFSFSPLYFLHKENRMPLHKCPGISGLVMLRLLHQSKELSWYWTARNALWTTRKPQWMHNTYMALWFTMNLYRNVSFISHLFHSGKILTYTVRVIMTKSWLSDTTGIEWQYFPPVTYEVQHPN